MNVVLVGYRGTGKSVVAEVLGRELGLDVVSLDAEIERRAGKRIPTIVEEAGWSAFRDMEEEVLMWLCRWLLLLMGDMLSQVLHN